MNLRKINWPLWAGLLLSLIASFSFPLAFFLLEVPSNFRWVSLALYAIAAVLLFIGLRRAFGGGSRKAKVAAAVATTLSVLLCVFFVLRDICYVPMAANFDRRATGRPEGA